jgi:proline iminopeptidase
VYPDEWDRFVSGVPEEDRDGDLLEAYRRLLDDPDAETRARAARDFTAWELATAAPGSVPSPRWSDPAFQLARSRIVTHYFTHDCWVDDGSLLDGAAVLRDIPAVIVNGELDPLAPLRSAEALAAAWPGAELVIVDGAAGVVTRRVEPIDAACLGAQ